MNEEREREELGELPEDLMRERGEVIVGDKPPYDPRRVPADVDYQQEVEEQQKDVPGGSLSQGARVVSVYDTRPVNGEDFVKTDSQQALIEPTNGAPDVGVFVRFFFRVPEGLIAVLRGFSVDPEFDLNRAAFDGTSPALTFTDPAFIFRLRINNIAVKGYDDVGADRLQINYPTHVIAGSDALISLEIANVAERPAGMNQHIIASFYGQLLLSTGRETQYEIGEPVKARPVVPRSPPESKPTRSRPGVRVPKRQPQKRDRGMQVSVARPAGGRRRGPTRGTTGFGRT